MSTLLDPHGRPVDPDALKDRAFGWSPKSEALFAVLSFTALSLGAALFIAGWLAIFTSLDAGEHPAGVLMVALLGFAAFGSTFIVLLLAFGLLSVLVRLSERLSQLFRWNAVLGLAAASVLGVLLGGAFVAEPLATFSGSPDELVAWLSAFVLAGLLGGNGYLGLCCLVHRPAPPPGSI